MAVRGGKKVSDITRGGLRLRSIDAFRDSVLFMDAVNTAPTTTTGIFSLYVSGTSLIFNNGSGTTTIGAAGAGGTPTWETIFASDATFTMTPDNTFTIAGNRATATDVVTITNIGGGSGSCLQFTNSGSGNDIDGTSNLWSVTATGVASFAGLTLTGANTITTSSGDITWTLEDNDTTALIIGASGDTNMMTFDTSNAAPVVRFGDGMALTDGAATFTSTSNTIANVAIINNTITTFGADASSAGAVSIRSTSLTTGSLLQLQLSDTANAGGFYLTCRESVGGTNDLTIGENGVLAMAGTAASDSLTVTAGDFLMSDGSITITDADNAASLSITNNTATTASVFALTGSGVFTGTTTTSFATITETGGTAGTTLYISSSTATTSVAVVDISAAALTTGSALRITPGSATIIAGGKSLEINHGSAVAGNGITVTTTGAYTGTGMVLLTAGAATTGILVSLVSTTGLTSGSLLRATTSTAGALATNGAISLTATGDFTSTAVTNGGFVEVKANSTTAGTIVNVVGTALTTGIGLILSNGTSAITTGSMLRVNASGTGAIATNGVISLTHAGIFTSTSAIDGGFVEIKANATTAGTAVNVLTTGLITGVALGISNGTAATTTGSLLRIAAGGTGAIATNGIVSFTHTGIYTSTSATDGGFVEVKANSTTAGTIINVLGTGLTTGIGMHISNGTAATTSGSLLRVTAGGTGAVATNGIVSFVHTGVYTSSTVGFLNVSASGTTGGTVATVTGAAVTDGIGLQISNAAITTGFHLRCLGAAGSSMFSVGVNGATIIAGSALGTAALTITAGDLTLTSGSLRVSGRFITTGTETIAAGGTTTALSLTVSVHYIDADAGGDIFTLADGIAGQITTVLLTSSTGVATVTPTNLAGGTSVTLNSDGDSVVLQFMDTEWFILGGNSYTVI